LVQKTICSTLWINMGDTSHVLTTTQIYYLVLKPVLNP
jgi:hypothetical protein